MATEILNDKAKALEVDVPVKTAEYVKAVFEQTNYNQLPVVQTGEGYTGTAVDYRAAAGPNSCVGVPCGGATCKEVQEELAVGVRP